MSRLGRPPVASSPAAVGALVAANLLSLVGVLWFGWGLFDVLAVYGVESGVVGLLNVPKIPLARGTNEDDSTFAATVNGRPVNLSEPDESALVDGSSVYAANVPIAGFFALHYGIFWVVHGVFVLHVTLVLGALLVGLKTGFDALAHLREHGRIRGRRGDGASGTARLESASNPSVEGAIVAETPRDAGLNRRDAQSRRMTDDADDAPREDAPDEREERRHRFSEGQGFDEEYEEFSLDPPELKVDPSKVDPVDSRVLTDILDRRNVDQDEVDVQSLVDVGLSYMQINRFEEATETFERAARYADEDSLDAQEAWVNKGAAHSQLEEYDEAIGAYREALRIDDDSEHAASAETNLAYALWEFGETEEALEHAERAVEIDPRFPQAWYNRGFFLAERGLHEDAVNAFDNAIRLGMRNADVLEEKARALEELGEFEEAEEVQEQADEIREEAEEQLVEEYEGRQRQGRR